ncbi:MAG: glycoside hydrolase family 2 protein [Anaerolineae bacterium]
MNDIISLNGWWDWRLPNGLKQKKLVPSCYTCVGDAFYSREMELPAIEGRRVALHFEGVSYCGDVSVNGKPVGQMLPYVPYDWDVTALVSPGRNLVEVTVSDVTARYGPTNGWEDYGGISRDVWVELSDPVGIADTQWITSMKNNYTAADATLNVWLRNETGKPASANVTAKLTYKGDAVATASAHAVLSGKEAMCTLHFSLDRIYTWSTGEPNLYALRIETASPAGNDARRLDVGFREFTVRGSRFYLNGVQTFLKGVARHDMWGDDQGFTLTREQIEQDLLLIKKMGANFVRLVHYPHSRYTIEYAAKIGLMVSEEPGLWWSDLGSEPVIASALEILRRTVLRDRCNPAVVAWLFFNECVLDDALDYLQRGAELCRSLDPTRLISGASCMSNETNKRVFDDAQLDFYTQHPYCYDGADLLSAAEVLRGKPLVFTEWGGWLIHFNPNLIANHKHIIATLAHAEEGEPTLSGMCWWQWQDILQYSRGLHGCIDGVLNDGLVDRFRVRKPTYAVMAEFFDLVDSKPLPRFELVEHATPQAGELAPLDLSMYRDGLNDRLWREAIVKDNEKRFAKTPSRKAGRQGIMIHRELKTLSGLLCDIPAGRPVILRTERKSICVPVGRNVEAVHLFGAVTYYDGYPLRGKVGEAAAGLTLRYCDGSAETLPLRHGYELASASLIGWSSRINALASKAPRIATITLDADREVYAINLLSVAADPGKQMESVVIEALDDDFEPVVYGISVKTPEGQ